MKKLQPRPETEARHGKKKKQVLIGVIVFFSEMGDRN